MPGEEFQYWRWASALSLAVFDGSFKGRGGGKGGTNHDSAEDSDDDDDDGETLRGLVKELKAFSPGSAAEKSADAVCTLRPATGMVTCF